jgi:hypothetical protein
MPSKKSEHNWKTLKKEFLDKYNPTQKILLQNGGLIMPFNGDGMIYGANLQRICDFTKSKGVFFFLTKKGVEIHE